MRRLSVVLLLAAYQANETSCYPNRQSRDLAESNEELSSDVDHQLSRRLTRDAVLRRPYDENEMMDTAETNIFPPAFQVIERQKQQERRKTKKYILVDVATVNDVPIVINAQVVPTNDVNYLDNFGFGGFGGFGGFRR